MKFGNLSKESIADHRKGPSDITIPTTKSIVSFIHCKQCVEELVASGLAPNEETQGYFQQDLEVGFTPLGIQIWCREHKCNVLHMNFEGQKHPANTRFK